MTLIDKAEALAMLRKHANGETVLGGQVYQSLTLETALEAIAAIPARGVGVKPMVWEGDEEARHDLIARPDPFHTYTVRPLGDARFDVILNHELGSLWFRQRKGEIWPDYASAKAAAQADYEARILAALAPDAALVRVKALEWEPSVIGKPWHSAKSPWGFYYAQWDDETQAWFASLEMGEVEAPIILSPSDVPSLEAAKAAAQADYEARILAALELPTSLQKVQRTLAPTDAAQAPFRMEDMTLADLMRDQLYEEATTPATGAEQAREAALREAAEFIRQDNFDATVRFDPKRHDGLRAWIRDQQASGILALIGERP